MKKIIVAINTSSARSSRENIKKIKKFVENYDTILIESSDIYYIEKKIKANLKNTDLVIACGGDGTFSTVANLVVHKNIPVSIVPLGSGNVVARAFSISESVDKAIKIPFQKHKKVHLDAIKQGRRNYFLNLTIGISSAVIKDTSTKEKNLLQSLAYTYHGVRHTLKQKRIDYELNIDGKKFNISGRDLVISNIYTENREFYNLIAKGSPTDGIIECTVFTVKEPVHYLELTKDVIIRQDNKKRYLEIFSVKKNIKVKTQADIPIQADGDLIKHNTINASIVKKAIKLIVPEKAKPFNPKRL